MKKLIPVTTFVLLIVMMACTDRITKQYQPLALNPYDTLHYNNNAVPSVLPDSNTFLGIHQYILKTRCAQPACHDGSFEPDYRTVQSAYNTLVFAKVKKNNTDSTFTYRVVPGDTAMSWLHERLTMTGPDRMPSGAYPLPSRQIKMITDWIGSGAKDMFGNVPQQPNAQPAFFGIYAKLLSNGMRVDSVRGNSPVNPFMVPANTDVDIWFGVYDDNTLPPLMGVRKIKFSTDPLNFNNATAYDLITDTQPSSYPAYNNVPVNFYFLHYHVNTSAWTAGIVVYMRVYVQDTNHSTPTEIPSSTAPFYLQTYFAFVVQ